MDKADNLLVFHYIHLYIASCWLSIPDALLAVEIMSDSPLANLLKIIMEQKQSSLWEAAMFASGFSTSLNPDQAIDYLKKGLKTDDFDIKKAAIAGLGFIYGDDSGKKNKKAYKSVNDYANDSLASVRLITAISSGKVALFTRNKKLQEKTYKDILKSVQKNEDPASLQGMALSIGLLGSLFPDLNPLSTIVSILDRGTVEDLTHIVLGITLNGMGSGKIDETVDLLTKIVKMTGNKPTRFTIAICMAFLVPMLSDPVKQLDTIDFIISERVEYLSRLGTDSAMLMSYFRLLENKLDTSDFFKRLEQWKALDPDYKRIHAILTEDRSGSVLGILHEVLVSNQIDVRVAGIYASFLLEKYELFDARAAREFTREITDLQPLGFFDSFLITLRLFSLALLRKDFTFADKFLETLATADPRVRRFSALAHACLSSMKEDYDYLKDFDNLDNDTKWGYLLGLALKERLVEMPDPLADELLLGLLLLDLGKINESIPLLLISAGLS